MLAWKRSKNDNDGLRSNIYSFTLEMHIFYYRGPWLYCLDGKQRKKNASSQDVFISSRLVRFFHIIPDILYINSQ